MPRLDVNAVGSLIDVDENDFPATGEQIVLEAIDATEPYRVHLENGFVDLCYACWASRLPRRWKSHKIDHPDYGAQRPRYTCNVCGVFLDGYDDDD